IARRAIEAARMQRPDLPIAAFGLYGLQARDVVDRALAGESNAALVAWVEGRDDDTVVHLQRDAADADQALPARDLLPALDRYARLAVDGEERIVGYVEAS